MTHSMPASIVRDLHAAFGLTFSEALPVSGGWLNQKWRISTERGPLLVKQYSLQRYRPDKLVRIEEALQRQLLAREKGVRCPFLLQRDGKVLRRPDPETVYMVMEFCKGRIETPETLSPVQMESLGETCGQLHRVLSELPAEPVLPTAGGYSLILLERFFSEKRDGPAAYSRAIRRAEEIFLGLDQRLFDQPRGLAHEDIQPGNLLFDEQGVTALIDFDRCCFSFPAHDIGRALLSFALGEEGISREKADAFREGYSRYLPLSIDDLQNALRLSWCIELPWWFTPDFFRKCSGVPARFLWEMRWITEHWERLL